MNSSRKNRLKEVKTEIQEVKHDLKHITNDTLKDWAKEHLDTLNLEKKDLENEEENSRWM